MKETNSRIYTFEDFRLDASKRLLFNESDEPVPLMPKAFEILLYLVQNSGRVIEKDEMMSAVWPDTIVEENNLTQNISALRRVLGEKHRDNRFIATVPGRGYKFVAEVHETNDAVNIGGDETENEISVRSGQPPKSTGEHERSAPTKPISRRKSLAALGLLILIGLVSTGLLIWRERSGAGGAEPVRSLAVLPFKPLAAQARDESLELGMADTLIMKLGSNPQLAVRPVTAVRRFDALDQDAVEAGKALGVDAVIEGNIQSAGGRVRVAAKLIRISDGKQLWAGQFEESSTDIFAIQDSITQRAAEALRIALGTQGGRRYTDNIEAYGLYMKGRFHALKLIRPEIEKGISYFEQAIAIDPNYTLPYIGLADAARGLVLTSDVRPTEAMPNGIRAAKKAVELDPQLSEGWTALASYSFWYDANFRSAEQQFKKAIELDPNNAQAHVLYSHMLSNLGRHDEALAEIKRARQLDPVSIIASAIEGQILFFAGRDDEALKSLQATSELDQNFWLVPLFETRIYLRNRMYEEAIAAARKASELSRGNAEAEATIGYALAKSGRRNEALKILSGLEKRAASAYVPSYDLALLHLALGERAEALNLLEKAFDDHEALTIFLKVDPKWDELRDEPRFHSIMKLMHFED